MGETKNGRLTFDADIHSGETALSNASGIGNFNDSIQPHSREIEQQPP
jgi:hypothetical protein